MLASININNVLLTMINGRNLTQTRSYPFNKFQTGETEIAEYKIPLDVVEIQNNIWKPKRVLTTLTPHLIEIMEDSVMVSCIYCFGLYQQRSDHPENIQSLAKYLEVIFKYEDEPGTAEVLITDSIEGMRDYPIMYCKEDGDIILNVIKTEMYFKDDGYIRKFDLNTYKEDNCIICMENKPNILFCNCGHLIICEDCYHKYQEDKCPKCRRVNNNIKRIS